jgi:hypothetical protein
LILLLLLLPLLLTALLAACWWPNHLHTSQIWPQHFWHYHASICLLEVF